MSMQPTCERLSRCLQSQCDRRTTMHHREASHQNVVGMGENGMDHSSSSIWRSSSKIAIFRARFARFFASPGERRWISKPCLRAIYLGIDSSAASAASPIIMSTSCGSSFWAWSGFRHARKRAEALSESREGHSLLATRLFPPADCTAAPMASRIVSCQRTCCTYSPLLESCKPGKRYADILDSRRDTGRRTLADNKVSASTEKPRRFAALSTAGQAIDGIFRRTRHFWMRVILAFKSSASS